MKTSKKRERPIAADAIQGHIYLLRGQKVMIDRDVAEFYGVPTKTLNRAVKKNLARFPHDFLFQLTAGEAAGVKGGSRRNLRYTPYAFTEPGVAMLATVLNSERAIEASVAAVRGFVKLRFEAMAELVVSAAV